MWGGRRGQRCRARDGGGGGIDGGEDFLSVGLKEVVDNPYWCCESLDHAPADGGELLLPTRRFYLVDFELDEVGDRNDHLIDDSLTVQHLQQV